MRLPLLAIAILPVAAAAQEPPPADLPPVERVHVVEKRPFTEQGRWELSGFAPVQVNPKFTIHAGFSAEGSYHLRENLAVQIGLTWFPLSRQSGLSEELLTKAGAAPTAAEAFLLTGSAIAGLELMPIYGKLNVFDGKILRLGFYLNAGLGAGKTRLQLRPSSDPGGRTFGDTGFRPVGQLGAGFRVFVNERFTVRLELRDYAYSAHVSRVNGCSYDDAAKIGASPPNPADLSGGCDPRAFGADPDAIRRNARSAEELLRNPSSDVINNLVFQGGVSWLF